jgi:hypothetical protein
MANTTFNGPVRSENGFIGATKNTSTGVFTNYFEITNTGLYVGTKLQGQVFNLYVHLRRLLLQVTLDIKLVLLLVVLNW